MPDYSFAWGWLVCWQFPFLSEVGWWKVLLFASLLLVFLVIFFRSSQYRIWLFITGFILLRFIYAVIGLPVKGEREFDYKELAKGIVLKSNYQPVYYWGRPDTLNMNVVVGDTLFRWKDKPVKVLPYYIRYQVPYYFYRATGSLMKFDTIMEAGKTYVSYNPYEKNNKIEPIDSFYDKHLDKYLIVFKKAKRE